VEQVRALADTFNRLGETCRGEGLQFGYHNHAHEFAPLDGTHHVSSSLPRTPIRRCKLEMDLFWAQVGGMDAIRAHARVSRRMPLLHLQGLLTSGTSERLGQASAVEDVLSVCE
jgi:sugar phosphate isomerase/epimerase